MHFPQRPNRPFLRSYRVLGLPFSVTLLKTRSLPLASLASTTAMLPLLSMLPTNTSQSLPFLCHFLPFFLYIIFILSCILHIVLLSVNHMKTMQCYIKSQYKNTFVSLSYTYTHVCKYKTCLQHHNKLLSYCQALSSLFVCQQIHH